MATQEFWYLTNTQNRNLTITDVPGIPVLKPGVRIEILQYANASLINRSIVLRNYINKGYVGFDQVPVFTQEGDYRKIHNEDAQIQGGIVGERYHFAKIEHDRLTLGLDASGLHTHDDKADINHSHGEFLVLGAISSDLSSHISSTQSVHGIADTSDLVLKSGFVSQLSDITSAGAAIENAVSLAHTESHLISSHSDTSATGAQLNILVGRAVTTLHNHTHNVLSGLQGGEENQYYHLNQSEYEELINWLDNVDLDTEGGFDIDAGLAVFDALHNIITFGSEERQVIFEIYGNTEFNGYVSLQTHNVLYFGDGKEVGLYYDGCDFVIEFTNPSATCYNPSAQPIGNPNFKLDGDVVVEGTITSYYFIGDGSLLTNINVGSLDHNSLAGLQGGQVAEYFHLTSVEHVELTNWLDNVVLDTNGSVDFGSGDLETSGNVWINQDYQNLYFGNNRDVAVYYDGCDLNIDFTNPSDCDDPSSLQGLVIRASTVIEGDLVINGTVSGEIDFWLDDNEKIYFGNDKDTEIYYDGTDFIINSQVMGSGDVIFPNDNQALALGAGSGGDARIYYDGTDLVIDSQAVGTGDVLFNKDNQALALGAGSGGDARLYYNGDDLYILPDVIGSGGVIIQPQNNSTETVLRINQTTNDFTAYFNNYGIFIEKDVSGSADAISSYGTYLDLNISKAHSSGAYQFPNCWGVLNDIDITSAHSGSPTLYLESTAAVFNDIDVARTLTHSGGGLYYIYGVRNEISNIITYNNSSGTYMEYIYGSYNLLVNTPTLTAGTLTSDLYGVWVSVTGNTSGTSTGYGLYISTVTGSGTNYGIYDVSGADWYISGNVGINTSSPSEELEVQGNIWINQDYQNLYFGNNRDVAVYYDGCDLNIDFTNPSDCRDPSSLQGLVVRANTVIEGDLVINGTVSGEIDFWLDDNEKIYFGNDKDTEIYYDGTDFVVNPKSVGSGEFHVLGGIVVDDYVSSGAGSVAQSGVIRIANNEQIKARNAADVSDNILMYSDTSNRVNINSNNWVFSNTSMRGQDGAVGAPAWHFQSDTDTGIYRIGGDNLGISLGGVKRVDLSTNLVDFTSLGIITTGDITIDSDASKLYFGDNQDASIYFDISSGLNIDLDNPSDIGPRIFLNDDVEILGELTVAESLTLLSGSITDSTGTISFGDENLTTTGTITAEHLYSTDDAVIDDQLSVTGNSSFGYVSVDTAIGINVGYNFSGTDTIKDGMKVLANNTFIGGGAPNFRTIYGMEFVAQYVPSSATSTMSSGTVVGCLGDAGITLPASQANNITATYIAGFVGRNRYLDGASTSGVITIPISTSFYADTGTTGVDYTLTLQSAYYDAGQTAGATNYSYYNAGGADSFMGLDNAAIIFGTGKDASITYDNTDLVIDSQLMGSGDVLFPNDNQALALGAGTGGDARIYYDATNLVFDSQAVGTGDFSFSNGDILLGADNQKITFGANQDASIYFDIDTGLNIGIDNPSDIGPRIKLNDDVDILGELTVNLELTVSGITTFEDKVIIDITDTEAFLIRQDGNSGDVFIVDTTNKVFAMDTTIDTKIKLKLSQTYATDNTDNIYGIDVNNTYSGDLTSGFATYNIYAGNFINTVSGDNTASFATVRHSGVYGTATYTGEVNHSNAEIYTTGGDFTGTFSGTNTNNGTIGVTGIKGTAGGSIGTTGNTFLAGGEFSVTGTADAARGLWVSAVTATTTNNYGLYINTVANGSSNYGIWDQSGKDWVLGTDNQAIIWGTSQDASIEFDGTNLIVDPKVVGSGGVVLAGQLGLGDEVVASSNFIRSGWDWTGTSGTLTGFVLFNDLENTSASTAEFNGMHSTIRWHNSAGSADWTGPINAMTGQTRTLWTSSSNISDLRAFTGIHLGDSDYSGTITNLSCYHVGAYDTAGMGTGYTVTNAYGLYIGDISASVIANAYAIYTGLGDVSFGDDVFIRNDEQRIWFGTNQNSAIYANGCDLVIDINANPSNCNNPSNLSGLSILGTGDVAQSVIAAGLVVNEDGGSGADYDFRVETGSNTTAFRVDTANNKVIIGPDTEICGTKVAIEWRDYSTIQDNDYVPRNLSETPSADTQFQAPWGGSVVGISITSGTTHGTYSTYPQYDVWINGASTGLTAEFAAADYSDYATAARGTHTFVAGDLIQVHVNDWTYSSGTQIMHVTITVFLVFDD